MSTAWTIRSRRNATTVQRPASLSSLPDLSDELEIGSRPSSGASGLFESWGQTPRSSNNYNCQSNISVSFLGSRIKRQYRSAFLLSDEHVVGVSRNETFHSEDAKVDVRINLSVQGPPSESITPGHRRSQSAPSLIRDNLDENRGWARIMLTTDRPRDSEILGRIGSRSYFSKAGTNSPYSHRRITPLKKEEEYIIGVNTLRENTNSEERSEAVSDTLVSGTASDGVPSIDRLEKDTHLDTARRLGSPARPVAISQLPRVSLSDKNKPQTPIPDVPPQSINLQSSESLPSTERSESILHLKHSKSESSLSARTLNSVRTPWNQEIREKKPAELSAGHAPESPMRESITPHIDNTLSLRTDLEEDDEVEKTQGSKTEKNIILSPASLPKVQNSEDSATATSALSFVSATNGIVVQLGGPDGQECISSYYGQSPMMSTVLYTTLQNTINLGSDDDSTKAWDFNEMEQISESLKVESIEHIIGKNVESIEHDFHPPLPKERKRTSFEQEELSDNASQTDYSLRDSSTLTYSPVKESFSGGSEQSFELTTRLPPIPEKKITQTQSPSLSSTSGDGVTPKVAPRRYELKRLKSDRSIIDMKPGDQAPDFSGTAVVNMQFKNIIMKDYRGKYCILFFYPFDFSLVCPTEILAFNDRLDEFKKINCEVIACSTDSQFSHLAWCNVDRKQGGLGPLQMPLLADKNMEISHAYGVLDNKTGSAYRGIFIISPEGKIRSFTVNDNKVGRSVDEALRLVEAFQFTDKHGEVCPVNWKKGEKGINAK